MAGSYSSSWKSGKGAAWRRGSNTWTWGVLGSFSVTIASGKSWKLCGGSELRRWLYCWVYSRRVGEPSSKAESRFVTWAGGASKSNSREGWSCWNCSNEAGERNPGPGFNCRSWSVGDGEPNSKPGSIGLWANWVDNLRSEVGWSCSKCGTEAGEQKSNSWMRAGWDSEPISRSGLNCWLWAEGAGEHNSHAVPSSLICVRMWAWGCGDSNWWSGFSFRMWESSAAKKASASWESPAMPSQYLNNCTRRGKLANSQWDWVWNMPDRLLQVTVSTLSLVLSVVGVDLTASWQNRLKAVAA